jgi:hypothetical protein
MVIALLGLLVFLFRLLGMIDRAFTTPGPCLHGREWGETREVAISGNNWEVIQSDSGDVDVLPLREDHSRGAGCICGPRVDIEGANLIVIHNSFDNREIVEEAVRIMNGVE